MIAPVCLIYVALLAGIWIYLLMARSTNDDTNLDSRLLLFIFGMSMFSLLLAVLFNYQPYFVEEDHEIVEDEVAYPDRSMKS